MIYLHFPLNWAKTSVISFFIPRNISYYWNLGSMAGIVLVVQIITGLLLSFLYATKTPDVFFLLNIFCKDRFWGFILRIIHLNFASLFFFCIYLHMFRGLFYKRFFKVITWSRGVSIMLILIATAFLGYVLPWGQISFWGATVITNMFSAIPYIGTALVIWLWGDFRVRQTTLRFFYSIHFLLPFILSAVVIFHIIFLHETGSKSKLYLNNKNKFMLSEFRNYLLPKDYLNLFLFLLFFEFFLLYPYFLGDEENFILANSLASPIHIKPEWYFLFAYAILRSIPNKLGGVVALVLRVVLFYVLPFKKRKNNSLFMKFSFYLFLAVLFLLTWLGGNPVEAPYIMIGQVLTILYFLLLFFI